MSKNVSGQEIALAAFITYLDYLMRSEINELIKEDPARQDYSDQLIARVGGRIVKDYKDHGPRVMNDLGHEIKQRFQNASN
jgi:hypothetical protein